MVRSRFAGLAALALALAALAAGNASAASPFPVTVTAANGKVTLTKRPARIVSLSPTATEDLFAIGAGPQVVAVDDQSDYPARAPRTKLSGYTPNAEAIAAYRPDLVVVSADLGKVVSALGKLKIPVLLQPPAATLDDAYAQVRQLGQLTGRERGAAKVVASMRRSIAAAVASAPKPKQPLDVYAELDPTYYTATSKTFVGRIFALLGLRNIADRADRTGSGYPQLSAEYVIAADPDVIVLADTRCCGQTPSKVAARPGWSSISAVRNGAVVSVDDSVASRWGPRIVTFVRQVTAKLRAAASAGA